MHTQQSNHHIEEDRQRTNSEAATISQKPLPLKAAVQCLPILELVLKSLFNLDSSG